MRTVSTLEVRVRESLTYLSEHADAIMRDYESTGTIAEPQIRWLYGSILDLVGTVEKLQGELP